ncbi:hypothetical protein IDJ77_25340 [Mucilaginibacter sp. ZT4R22]|uniref:DUF4142 domain-containing protein n=1 Tax=Mucilaginibacter pankratovii TaxID=2772110 RepID=A0ABR7WXZ7_9SPHI|nr:hypothetical protein [Mucilaginibacter pankratovii]MBD1367161.1 hypothetical protein [Mucilaginibacter pankratovii]
MTTKTLLPVLLLCVCFLGCGREVEKADAGKAEVPEPLKDKSSAALLVKSDVRRFSDGSLVDELYNDLAEKQPELQTLESQLKEFYAARTDSVEAFDNYYAKSDSYYSSANSLLLSIKDSVLKQRLGLLLEASKNKLQKKTSRFSMLIANADKESRIMEDYHQALKLVATLPVIETYQDKNMPGIKPVQKLSDEAKRLNNKTQALVKKYGGN